MSDKILQIIPAPADMWAVFRTNKPGVFSRERVACLALIENEDGCTGIAAMIHDGLAGFEPAWVDHAFVGIEYGEVQP